MKERFFKFGIVLLQFCFIFVADVVAASLCTQTVVLRPYHIYRKRSRERDIYVQDSHYAVPGRQFTAILQRT